MLQTKRTVSEHVKKTRTNSGDLKSKAEVDKQFRFKLNSIQRNYQRKRETVEYNPQEETCQLHKYFREKTLLNKNRILKKILIQVINMKILTRKNWQLYKRKLKKKITKMELKTAGQKEFGLLL